MKETLTKIRPEDDLLVNVRPARESFTHGDIPITGEGLYNLGTSGPLNSEGSLSCHTCCDTESQGFFSVLDHPNLRTAPHQSP